MEITETFYPKNRTDWRDWLGKHHADKREIWLGFYRKHTGKQVMSYQEAVDEALCFGWIDGMEKKVDEERYVLRFTPRTSKSKWSEGNVARYKFLVKEGLMMVAGVKAFERKEVIYKSFRNKKSAVEWHEKHKMPKSPSLEVRIIWHREHQRHCGCRPVPHSLRLYL